MTNIVQFPDMMHRLPRAVDVYQRLVRMCDKAKFQPQDTEALMCLMLASWLMQREAERARDTAFASLKDRVDWIIDMKILLVEDDDPPPAAPEPPFVA